MFICLIVSKKKMNQVLSLTFILQDSMLIQNFLLKKLLRKSLKKHPVATAYTVIIKARNCSHLIINNNTIMLLNSNTLIIF